MRCTTGGRDITEVVFAYIIPGTLWLMTCAMNVTSAQDFNMEMSSLPSDYLPYSPEEELCCSGVLGYASDNLSLNFPCQNLPCCNSSDTVAVVAIDFAMGFRFQCMPIKSIEPLCYETGAEVRTTNQDPDFIPRACCSGLKFKVVVNQWYAAMVVKCVEEKDNEDNS